MKKAALFFLTTLCLAGCSTQQSQSESSDTSSKTISSDKKSTVLTTPTPDSALYNTWERYCSGQPLSLEEQQEITNSEMPKALRHHCFHK